MAVRLTKQQFLQEVEEMEDISFAHVLVVLPIVHRSDLRAS
jgi:hypothetical protein